MTASSPSQSEQKGTGVPATVEANLPMDEALLFGRLLLEVKAMSAVRMELAPTPRQRSYQYSTVHYTTLGRASKISAHAAVL